MVCKYDGEILKEEMLKWSQENWDDGYTFSTKEIMKLLNVSNQWVYKKLGKLKSVQYPRIWFIELRNSFSILGSTLRYFKKEEVLDLLLANSEFTVQTKKFSVDDCLKSYPNLFSLFDPIFGNPDAAFEILTNFYKTEIKQSDVCFSKFRGKYKVFNIEPFDFFNSEYVIIPANLKSDNSVELKYRNAVERGAIKVKIFGFKTLFISQKSDIEEYLTVRYDLNT